MGKTLAIRAPSVEELACERCARLDFCDHIFRAEHERHRAVAGGLLGLALGRGEPAIADCHERAFGAATDRIAILGL